MSRTLFDISVDIETLNELLSEWDEGDEEQSKLITEWFERLGSERDKKLDGYCALITEITARAEARKAEAKRLAELAATDERRARFLKDRLKWFFELHKIKSIDTPRYKLTLAKNGGKAPLYIDNIRPIELPPDLQKVTIEPDTAAIREVLEGGEQLSFARLGERGTSLRIK